MLVIKKDWSVPVHFHYFMKKAETNVLDALNEYLYVSRERGDAEKGYVKWFQLDVTHSRIENTEWPYQAIFGSLGPLNIVLGLVFGGSGMALLTSLFRCCWLRMKNVRTMSLEGEQLSKDQCRG